MTIVHANKNVKNENKILKSEVDGIYAASSSQCIRIRQAVFQEALSTNNNVARVL